MHANNATKTTPCVGATNVRPPPSEVGRAVVGPTVVASVESEPTIVVSVPEAKPFWRFAANVKAAINLNIRIN